MPLRPAVSAFIFRGIRVLRVLATAGFAFACTGPLAQAQITPSADPQAAANRFWTNRLTRCGDSYYADYRGDGGPIEQYRMPSFPPPLPATMTEADRQNGYLWRGWAYATGKTWRSYSKQAGSKQEGWGPWHDSFTDPAVDPTRQGVLLKVEMWNLNGSWHFKGAGHGPHFLAGDLDETAQKLTCAEIPQTPELADGPYNVGDGVSEPRILYKVDPQYTDAARMAKLSGVVHLKIVVDVDGRAKDIQVLSGIEPGLDQKAIEAVQTWRFAPGKKNRQPVPVSIPVDVVFRLL
jgi:TonB family protein